MSELRFSPDDAAELYNLAAVFFRCEYGATRTVEYRIEVLHEDCVCDCCNLRRWFWQRDMRHNPLLTGERFVRAESPKRDGADRKENPPVSGGVGAVPQEAE